MTKTIFSAVSKMAMALCCAVALFASCQEEVASPVASVTLDETSLVLFTGQTHNFVATVLPDEALDKSVTWASADPTVASITENGELKALKTGETTVTVTTTDGAFTAECAVEVLTPMVPVQSVSLDVTELTIMLQTSAQLKATVLPADATVKEVVWTSSNPEIAEVTIDGQIVPKTLGQTVITATTAQGGKAATCVVTVDAVKFIVSFETNGGTAVADQVVVLGEKVKDVETTKAFEGGLPAGLYQGIQDPDQAASVFDGWYTDAEFTNAYDFATPVTENLTLHAKWIDPVSVDLASVSGADVLAKVQNFMNALTEEAKYTWIVDADYQVSADAANQSTVYWCKTPGELYIVGKDKEITFSAKDKNVRMFQVQKGHIYLGKNVSMTVSGEFNVAPVILEGGNMTILPGSKIKDCKVTSIGGGPWPASSRTIIYVNNAASVFTIDGGEIINNTVHQTQADYMCAPVCANNGKIIMKAGKVSGNKATSDANGIALCGGLYCPDGKEITKTGGVIEKNTAAFTEAAGSDPKTIGHVGQQIVFRAASQYWAGTDPYKGAFHIDQDLKETDNFSTTDLSNELWVKFTYKD